MVPKRPSGEMTKKEPFGVWSKLAAQKRARGPGVERGHDAVRGARVDVAAARLLETRAHVAAVRGRGGTERLRDCEPVPHDSVHVDQAIPHTRHTRRDHTTGDRNRPS